MKYRHLGGSGLRVSEVCLGTMLFGDRASAAVANAWARATGSLPRTFPIVP